MKKGIALLLALLMIAVLVVACGDDGGGATPPVGGGDDPAPGNGAAVGGEDHMYISILHWDVAQSLPSPRVEDAMRDFVEEKFNVTFTPVNVTWADADEQITLMSVAGTLPDIIGASDFVDSPQFFRFIADGIIAPLPEDLSPYPYLERVMNMPDVAGSMVDGRHWFLPRSVYSDASWWCMDRGIINRRDWRENLGFEIPVTEQDFIDLAVAYATLDPANEGVDGNRLGFVTRRDFLHSAIWTGHGNTDNFWWTRNAAGDVVLPAFEETSLPLMSFLRRMYNAGGMDPDFVTYTNQEVPQQFQQGRVGMVAFQVSPKHLFFNQMRFFEEAQEGISFLEATEILEPPLVVGNQRVRFEIRHYWSESYINANVDDAKMDRILQIYNWGYSDDGMRTMTFGLEGIDWEFGAGGEISILREINPATGFYVPLAERYTFHDGGMNFLIAFSDDILQYVNPEIPIEIRELTAAERDRRLSEWASPNINWLLQSIDLPEKALVSAIPITDYWTRFVTDTSALSDQDLWNQFRASWDASGYSAAVTAMTNFANERGW